MAELGEHPNKIKLAELLQDMGYDDIHDRLILLALLYREAGQEKQAIESLAEAKQLAEMYDFSFAGPDLLEELQRRFEKKKKSDE